jgi:predicted ATPase with chaperone activity
MLEARLPTILPPLTFAELLEVSMVASVAGEIEVRRLYKVRPQEIRQPGQLAQEHGRAENALIRGQKISINPPVSVSETVT